MSHIYHAQWDEHNVNKENYMKRTNQQYKLAEKLSNVSPVQEEIIGNKMYCDITHGKSPSNNPKLTFICGLPGVGKTTRARQIIKQNPNVVILGEDDTYKYHPHLFELNCLFPVKLNSRQPDGYDFIKKTNEDGEEISVVEDFATNVFNKCLVKAMVNKYDLVVDGIISDNLLSIASIAKSFGYDVNFDIITTPKRMQEINLINRYVDGIKKFNDACEGKYPKTAENVPHPFSRLHTSPEYVNELGNTLELIEANDYQLNIYDAFSAQKIYSNEDKNKNPAEVFIGEFYRNITHQEQENILKRKNDLKKVATKCNATVYEQYVINNVSRSY